MTEIISTIVIAAAAVVTAGATIVLAVITWRYVRLTKDILIATNKPQVILFLRYEAEEMYLCVENIGTGYASDVNFSGSLLSFKIIPSVAGEEGKLLKDLEPFKNGITYLGPGYKIDTFLFTGVRSNQVTRQTLSTLISYKDSANTEEKQVFTFQFGAWEDESQFIFPQIDDTASRLGRIANILESIRDSNLGNNNRNRTPNPFLKYENVQMSINNIEELFIAPTKYNAVKCDLIVRYVSGTERILTTGTEEHCKNLRDMIFLNYIMRTL